jgi:large subunit ribosomal protein L4
MAVVAQLANKRQGTQSAKTRSEVSGGGRKPWKQKGTGHARQGSTRSPQWTGGGVVFAPKPRDFSKKVNKQKRRYALLSAISTKLAQNEITVIDNFAFTAPKTKEAKAFVDAFKFTGKTLVVNAGNDNTIKLATANLPCLNIQEASDLNIYDILSNKNVVLTQSAIKSIEEAYAE